MCMLINIYREIYELVRHTHTHTQTLTCALKKTFVFLLENKKISCVKCERVLFKKPIAIDRHGVFQF